MTTEQSPGALLRKAVKEEQPLQLVGAVYAYAALSAMAVNKFMELLAV